MHPLMFERVGLKVREATKHTTHPFSWLSTKQVCQRWTAHFAAYPSGSKLPA